MSVDREGRHGKSRNTTDKLPPVHPGGILKETLDDPGISMNRLSQEIHVPANRISSIVAGQRAITGETALRLARYFATTPEYWLNMQARYGVKTARDRWEERVKSEFRPRRPRQAGGLQEVFSAALVILLCLAAGPTTRSAYGQRSARPPTFDEYRVAAVYKHPAHAPDFGPLGQYSGTDLRCPGEDTARYAHAQANFAGRFVVSACSCGSGCRYLFLWDAKSGKVYRNFPFGPIDVGPYGAGRGVPPVEYKGEQYRADSSLLVLDGCFEDTCDCAKRYYVWSAGQFKLLSRQPDPLPPECLHQ